MSTFKSFSIVGCGNLGSKILEELVQKKKAGTIDSIVVVSRSESTREQLSAKGVELRTVKDYEDVPQLATALRGSEVVLNTIAGPVAALQPYIARAAKAAGAQLFVLSDYGNSTEGYTERRFGLKESMKNMLREELKLPYATFYVGAIADFFFTKYAARFGFDFINGKFEIQGSGEAENSYTESHDIAKFVAHVLSSFPKEELEWRVFRIEGERTSWNRIIAEWEQRSGRKAEVIRRPIKEVQEKFKENPNNFIADLTLCWDAGKGTIGTREQVENMLWPEWKPKRAIDVIIENYEK